MYESVFGEWVCELHAGEAAGLLDEASTVEGGWAAAVPRVSCAYCSEPSVCENLFGELVCNLHEEMTDSFIDDTTDTAGSSGESGTASEARCVLCDCEMPESSPDGRDLGWGRCPKGHMLCVSCTTKYVELTLLPQGTVWWDTIDCVDAECTERLSGVSVQRCINDELAERIETRQFDAGHLICGERDPSSEAAVARFTRPCPNCNVPIEKNRGCDHMHCTECRFDYWWSCTCRYPGHSAPCERR